MNRKRFLLLLVLGLALAATGAVLRFLARDVLIVGGERRVRYALRKQTVRELIDHFQVRLSSQDLIQPDLGETLRWGEAVRVIRVTETLEPREETVDFTLDWKRRTSRNLRMVEVQQGYRTRATWQVRKTFHDGRLAHREETPKKTRKFPVTRLVLMGKNGYPEKIYDLSQAKKMTMIATAYWEGDPQVPGVFTYLDHRIERGIVAVDPNVIPLRSRLYIPGYGYAYASDTGSAIKGKRIDLVVPNKAASRAWEYKRVTVYVLEKAKHW